jgi:hypothetical protein
MLGVTRERVRQLRDRALKRLRGEVGGARKLRAWRFRRPSGPPVIGHSPSDKYILLHEPTKGSTCHLRPHGRYCCGPGGPLDAGRIRQAGDRIP